MGSVEVKDIFIEESWLLQIAKENMARDTMKYRKLPSGEYEVYCPTCEYRETMPYKEFKRIQSCSICPNCFVEKKTSRKPVDKTVISWLDIEDAVWMRYTWDFDEGFKVRDFFHCLHDTGKGFAVRAMHSFMYCVSARPEERDRPWRLTRSTSYGWNICNYAPRINGYEPRAKKSKKQYYAESMEELSEFLKPNQVKLLKDNLYNQYQIRNMVIFGLDYDDDIMRHKYRVSRGDAYYWMKDYATKVKLNKFYLTYLESNKIDFYTWMDHMKILHKLDMKLEKPKEFPKRHYELSRILATKEEAECKRCIEARYHSISKKEAVCNGFSIVAFKNSDEIVECGRTLKNCIASYLRSYSTGETDLFYMRDNKNKTVGAIEVQNGKLKQAYGPQNKRLPADQYKSIQNWVNTVYA